MKRRAATSSLAEIFVGEILGGKISRPPQTR
jgi:hypothetical protein